MCISTYLVPVLRLFMYVFLVWISFGRIGRLHCAVGVSGARGVPSVACLPALARCTDGLNRRARGAHRPLHRRSPRRLLPLRPPRGLLQTIPNGERSEREGLKEGVKKVRAARNGGEKRLKGERGRIHSVPGRLVTTSANDSRRGARAGEVLVMRFFLSTECEHPDESRIRRSWGLEVQRGGSFYPGAETCVERFESINIYI